MSLIKISPGAKITNSTISNNRQIGGETMIDNQGDIEDSNISRNLHVQHLFELPPDERFGALKSAARWLKDNVLAAVLIFILTTILGIYITRLLSPPQDQTRPAISEPKAMPV
ncbi:MAG: hypothetical protein PHD65_01170 [Gallionella sp.]|nr:hypothetical protein [Gallionella sp.]